MHRLHGVQAYIGLGDDPNLLHPPEVFQRVATPKHDHLGQKWIDFCGYRLRGFYHHHLRPLGFVPGWRA